jgi:thioredoxin 1
MGAQPHIAEAFSGHPELRHIKVADASGRRLGRSFRVKLWPTLVFLRDGVEVARLVRPGGSAAIREALAQLEAG